MHLSQRFKRTYKTIFLLYLQTQRISLRENMDTSSRGFFSSFFSQNLGIRPIFRSYEFTKDWWNMDSNDPERGEMIEQVYIKLLCALSSEGPDLQKRVCATSELHGKTGNFSRWLQPVFTRDFTTSRRNQVENQTLNLQINMNSSLTASPSRFTMHDSAVVRLRLRLAVCVFV